MAALDDEESDDGLELDDAIGMDLPDQTLSEPGDISKFRSACSAHSSSKLFTSPISLQEVCGRELTHIRQQFLALSGQGQSRTSSN